MAKKNKKGNSKERRRERRAQENQEIDNFEKKVSTPKAKRAQPLVAKNGNKNQQKYIEYIKRHTIILGTGFPGTGKTYIAARLAAEMLQDSDSPIDKIVICRPNIGVDESIGLLPGTVDEKMAPWARPVVEALGEGLGPAFVQYLIDNDRIEVLPLEHCRGRTLSNSFIILDEVQNISRDGLKAILTRIGEGSKLVIAGDVDQNDLGSDSGLKPFIKLCSDNYMPVYHVNFEIEDCMRNEVVKYMLKVFYENKF